MSRDPSAPQLDGESLAQIGIELRRAYQSPDRLPLSDKHRDLLLEYAVSEALAASDPSRSRPKTEGPRPLPIATAPKVDEGQQPIRLLLYSPSYGWHSGVWSDGKWLAALGAEFELHPTHWFPIPPAP